MTVGDDPVTIEVLLLNQSQFKEDVVVTAAIVLDAKRAGGLSAVLILGGGAPKNFLLQTEPQLQEILGVAVPKVTVISAGSQRWPTC